LNTAQSGLEKREKFAIELRKSKKKLILAQKRQRLGLNPVDISS
jgi:hypothetical protein